MKDENPASGAEAHSRPMAHLIVAILVLMVCLFLLLWQLPVSTAKAIAHDAAQRKAKQATLPDLVGYALAHGFPQIELRVGSAVVFIRADGSRAPEPRLKAHADFRRAVGLPSGRVEAQVPRFALPSSKALTRLHGASFSACAARAVQAQAAMVCRRGSKIVITLQDVAIGASPAPPALREAL